MMRSRIRLFSIYQPISIKYLPLLWWGEGICFDRFVDQNSRANLIMCGQLAATAFSRNFYWSLLCYYRFEYAAFNQSLASSWDIRYGASHKANNPCQFQKKKKNSVVLYLLKIHLSKIIIWHRIYKGIKKYKIKTKTKNYQVEA